MALTSSRFAGNARLQKAAENKPPLTQGEKGEAVAILQMALVDLGFPMPISTSNGNRLPDGVFGAETLGVVRAFQSRSGLAVDGVVGRQTLAQIEALTIQRSQLQAAAEAARTRQQTLNS